MAKERPEEKQAQGATAREEAREERSPAPRERRLRPAAAVPLPSPFALMRRFMEDLDRLVEFGFGPGPMPRIELSSRSGDVGESAESIWVPPVEVFERDGQLVVRADVPGLRKDQIKVEVEDGRLVISGERSQTHEEHRGQVYRSERTYGTFYRVVPLPEGVNPEQAKATFANGVLEIAMPAPKRPEARRLEIQETPSAEGPAAAQPSSRSA